MNSKRKSFDYYGSCVLHKFGIKTNWDRKKAILIVQRCSMPSHCYRIDFIKLWMFVKMFFCCFIFCASFSQLFAYSSLFVATCDTLLNPISTIKYFLLFCLRTCLLIFPSIVMPSCLLNLTGSFNVFACATYFSLIFLCNINQTSDIAQRHKTKSWEAHKIEKTAPTVHGP